MIDGSIWSLGGITMSALESKGILLISIVADVLRLEKEGRISREDLEEELCPDALKVLDTGVSPVSWYNPLVYRDLARILMRLEGKGSRDMEYLRKRGERAGQRLLESGVYQQLDYLKRQVGSREKPESRESFEQSLRLIVSMPAGFMKGGKWAVEQDPDYPDRVQIALTGIDGLPEENAQATCSHIAWRYEREGPNKITYRMDKDISALRFGSADDGD